MTTQKPVYVELLDEGTPTMRPVEVTALPNGLFRLEATHYDAEDEIWAFSPGSEVLLEDITLEDGTKGLLVRHSNPNVIRIDVPGESNSAFWMHKTNALHLGGGIYEILPTPHYNPNHYWQYTPGTVVRLKFIESEGFSYLVPAERAG